MEGSEETTERRPERSECPRPPSVGVSAPARRPYGAALALNGWRKNRISEISST